MKWTMGRQSDNVEDRRGMGLPVGGGMVALVFGLAYWFFTGDPSVVVNQVGGQIANHQSQPGSQDQSYATFSRQVLASTENVWGQIFRKNGKQYHNPTMVLYSGRVQSACGVAGSATGPFYCPNDQKLYLDTSFFDEMKQKLGAPGDFAAAYVIAHEVGHHVQNQLGILDSKSGSSQREANQMSVKTELQADYLAGVWASHAQGHDFQLEKGDLEEGLNAAAAVGDDRLQQQNQGYVVPDSFTHGTSAQRVDAFRRGFQTGTF